MNWKRFALAAMGGYVVLVATAALWHLALFPAYYADVTKALQAFLAGALLLEALRALALAYIYPIGYRGGNIGMNGLVFGVLTGLLAGFAVGIYLGAAGQPLEIVGTELVFLVIQGAASGIAVAWIHGGELVSSGMPGK